MAYGNKYLFKFEAQNGAQFSIYIKERNFTGTCLQRAMGRAPLLRRDQGDHICGTSLTIYAECQVDQEFADLYTSDANKYQVELYFNGANNQSTLMWQGFVSPELYAEPDIAPPYDVEIVATDGLGELKMKDWSPLSTKATLYSHITSLLAESGLSLSLSVISTLRTTGSTAATFWSTVNVDLGHLAGKTYYEVLEALLTSTNAIITQHGGQWKLIRPTDFAEANAGPIDSFGSMDTHSFWPVGQLESEIVPARNKIIVQSPNFYRDLLRNSDMSSQSAWNLSGNARYYAVSSQRERAYYGLSPAGYTPGSGYGAAGKMKQSFSITGGLPNLVLKVNFVYSSWQSSSTYDTKLGVTVKCQMAGVDYYLYKRNSDTNELKDFYWDTSVNELRVDSDQEIYLPETTSDLTLEVALSAQGTFGAPVYSIYSCYLSLFESAMPTGLQLNINLGNNARNESDPVVLSFSNYDDSTPNETIEVFQYGVPTISNTPALNWQTNLLTAQSYIGLAGMDLALLHALPRIRKKGKVFIPASAASRVPIAFTDGTITYLVEKYEYDLYSSEFSVEMISLPATSLTVSSQAFSSIVETGEGTTYSGGGGGGGTSGGTVTSVNISAPSPFTVSGGPITTSGVITIALQFGYQIPTTSQINTWNSYAGTDMKLKIADTPRIYIRRGTNSLGNDVNRVYVQHQLMNLNGAHAVLMIYRGHNKRETSPNVYLWKKGWAVAKGCTEDDHFHQALTSGSNQSYFELSALRDYLVKYFTFWVGKTASQLRSMTYNDWESEQNEEQRGFVKRDGRGIANLRLGIAVRVPNPDFVYTGTLDEDTQEINGQPKYFYSPVTELSAQLVSDNSKHNRRWLFFGIPR